MLSGLNDLKGKEVSIEYVSGFRAAVSTIRGTITKIAVDNNVTFIVLDNVEAINTRFIAKISVLK